MLGCARENGGHMNMVSQMLQWMNQHPNLSGWAQAFGAVLAILIAVAIPWYQRRAQMLDMLRTKAELDVVLSYGVSQLLTDAHIFLRNLPKTKHLARNANWIEMEVKELLERIRAIENREHDHKRITALFHVRGALLATNFIFARPDLQQNKLAADEIESIEKYVAFVKQQIPAVDTSRDRAIDVYWGMKLYWPARPIYFTSLAVHRTIREVYERFKTVRRRTEM
jgi:hypothetical protein